MGATTGGTVPEIVIITGMSGAGRSTAAKSMEDLEWFVVDNLPPGLLRPTLSSIPLTSTCTSCAPRW